MVDPANHPPQRQVNLIGLTRNDYKGRPSTLCQGCGHDSISSQHHLRGLRALDRRRTRSSR